eukprot:12884346-Prorocentrum_lima.AAC.1
MGELPGSGAAYPPPGFTRQSPNPTPGVMNSLSGRSQTFTPADDSDITFVDGKPVLNNPQSQDGNPWQYYKECGWKEAFSWKDQPTQQAAWGQRPAKQ